MGANSTGKTRARPLLLMRRRPGSALSISCVYWKKNVGLDPFFVCWFCFGVCVCVCVVLLHIPDGSEGAMTFQSRLSRREHQPRRSTFFYVDVLCVDLLLHAGAETGVGRGPAVCARAVPSVRCACVFSPEGLCQIRVRKSVVRFCRFFINGLFMSQQAVRVEQAEPYHRLLGGCRYWVGNPNCTLLIKSVLFPG